MLKYITFTVILFLFVGNCFSQDKDIPHSTKSVKKQKKTVPPWPKPDLTRLTIDSTKGSFGIDIDQDFFLDWLPNTNYDRNYTQGTAFSYTKYGLDESILFFPLNSVFKLLHLKQETDHIKRLPATIALGVTAFTPRDIADSLNPVIGDRPFANVVFLTTTRNSYNTKTRIVNSTSFSYGIIGSNIGNVFQSYAHISIVKGRPTNIGWQYQISNGGHPAFLFSHNARRSVFVRKADEKYAWLEGIVGTKINVGWYTGIAGFATIKLGKFGRYNTLSQGINNSLEVGNKRFEIIEKEAQNNTKSMEDEEKRIAAKQRRIMTEQERISSSKPTLKKSWDIYFFWTPSPRLTAYNSFVLGQPGVPSVYTLDKQNFNPFTLDNEFGIFISKLWTVDDVAVPIKNVDLILSMYSRTSEIVAKDATEKNPFQRTHKWGRVTLRFPLF